MRLLPDDEPAVIVEHGEAAFHLVHFLSIAEQQALLIRCREVASESAGPYRPRVRGGGMMHLDMLCLGRHWNAATYKYEDRRTDVDGQPVPPVPHDFVRLAARIATAVGYPFEPDICLMNHYSADGRLGLHQDRDESRESIEAGVPIVSVSIGDTARFLLGGLKRKDAVKPVLLSSGDAFVLAGPSRLRHHGVSRILACTAPAALDITGRINLTFRKY